MVIIKFSELTKKLFKIAKNNVTYGPIFAEGIIKAVAKNGSYAPYTFEGYYKGTRTINRIEVKIPFQEDELLYFLNGHINKNKLNELLYEFDIDSSFTPSLDILLRAIVLVYKDIFSNSDGASTLTIKEAYTSLCVDPMAIINQEVKAEEFHLINELHNLCPLCRNQKLVTSCYTNKDVRNFVSTKIFLEGLSPTKEMIFAAYKPKPTSLDDGRNIIALCPQCSFNYNKDQNFDTYKKLCSIKETAVRDSLLLDSADKYDMRETLENVIKLLVGVRSTSSLIELRLDALNIDKKILRENPLYDVVRTRAIKYYHFIDGLLNEMDGTSSQEASELAKNIKEMSRTLMLSGCTEDEVLNLLAEQLNAKIGGDYKTRDACHFLVAYFVQHCEVLSDEVS